MEVTAVSTDTTIPEASSRTEISSDFETFLRMLTVQMQNQDPSNPVDSSDFAVQLATFSNVEQQVQTNELLREMQGQLDASSLAQLADWVGKEARTSAAVSLNGSPITLHPTIANGAETANIVVRNSAGDEVTQIPIPTDGEPVEWAGVTSDGYPFASGKYTFDVESYSGDDFLSSTPAETYAPVTEVRRGNDGSTVVVLSGAVEVTSDEISALRAAS